MKTYNLCDVVFIQIALGILQHSFKWKQNTFLSLTIAIRRFSLEYFCCKFENVAVSDLMSHPSPV